MFRRQLQWNGKQLLPSCAPVIYVFKLPISLIFLLPAYKFPQLHEGEREERVSSYHRKNRILQWHDRIKFKPRSCHLSHNSFQAHSSSPFPVSVYFYLNFFPRYKLSALFWLSFGTWYELKLYYKCTEGKSVEKRSLMPYTLLCTPAYSCSVLYVEQRIF